MILSGVIQGDPLAGFLFVIILDPCLHLLYNTFEQPGYGYVRACADDLGAVLKDIRGLLPLHHAFELIRKATSLSLNIPKCVLIPLNTSISHHFIREWLYSNTPLFYNMHIDSFGEYLGILLGPTVGSNSFDKIISKYFSNCRKLSTSTLSPALLTFLYNSNSVSLFNYVLQVLPPTPHLINCERRMIHSVYKLPFNTHTSSSIFELALIGIPVPHSIYTTSLAARYRLKRSLHDALLFSQSHRDQYTDMLPVIGLCGWTPAGWTSPSLLSNLVEPSSIESVAPLSSVHHDNIDLILAPLPPPQYQSPAIGI